MAARKKRPRRAEDRLTYRFRLTDEEFARAWLREYYRRPGWRAWRIVGGPVFIAIGLGLMRSPETFNVGMGIAAIVLGLWYVLKPLLGARLLKEERRKSGRASVELELTLHANGIRIDDGTAKREIPWTEVVRSGARRDYVWYELRGGSRGTIPLRVVEDPPALRAKLSQHSAWQG